MEAFITGSALLGLVAIMPLGLQYLGNGVAAALLRRNGQTTRRDQPTEQSS